MNDKPRVQDKRVICRVCDAVNDYGTRFCSQCHSTLQRGRTVTEAESLAYIARRDRRARRSRYLRRAVFITGLLAIAAGISLWTLSLVRPPTLLRQPTTSTSSEPAAGRWVAEGFDTQNTRTIAASYPPLKGELKWRFQGAAGFLSSVTVMDGTVYLTTGDVEGRVIALDEETGAVRWQQGGFGPLAVTPTVAGDNLYVGLRRGTVVAIDRHTGELRWSAETPGYILPAVTVVKGEVFVTTGDRYVLSLDASTGGERWRRLLDSMVPYPVSVQGDDLVAGSLSGIHYFDVRTGQKVYTLEMPTPDLVGSPAIRDGEVYVFLERGYLLALDLKTRSSFWEKPIKTWWAQFYIWGMAPPPRAARSIVWSYRIPRGDRGTGMAVASDVIYLGTDQGRLLALDRYTHEPRWTFQGEEAMRTAPAIVGDTVLIGSGRYLYAINAVSGELQWRFEMAGQAGTSVVVTPRAAYIGDEAGSLYAVR